MSSELTKVTLAEGREKRNLEICGAGAPWAAYACVAVRAAPWTEVMRAKLPSPNGK